MAQTARSDVPEPHDRPEEYQIADTAEMFGLLADPGRLRLIACLRAGERNVGELAAAAGLSESATSHALRLLRAHRVVMVRRQGRQAFYSLADDHVRELLALALDHAAHSISIHPERGSGQRSDAVHGDVR